MIHGDTTDGSAANMGIVRFGEQEIPSRSHMRVRVHRISFKRYGHGPKSKTQKTTDIS